MRTFYYDVIPDYYDVTPPSSQTNSDHSDNLGLRLTSQPGPVGQISTSELTGSSDT